MGVGAGASVAHCQSVHPAVPAAFAAAMITQPPGLRTFTSIACCTILASLSGEPACRSPAANSAERWSGREARAHCWGAAMPTPKEDSPGHGRPLQRKVSSLRRRGRSGSSGGNENFGQAADATKLLVDQVGLGFPRAKCVTLSRSRGCRPRRIVTAQPLRPARRRLRAQPRPPQFQPSCTSPCSLGPLAMRSPRRRGTAPSACASSPPSSSSPRSSPSSGQGTCPSCSWC